MDNSLPAVNVENARVYLGGHEILHNISWQVQRGERCFILGANGAGKTTTIKSMTGLLKPDRGTVELDGKDMLADTMGLRMRIGYVPDFFGVYDNLKVSEYMEFFVPFVYAFRRGRLRRL